MNSITINGKTIVSSGDTIIVRNGKVISDGVTIQDNLYGDVEITIDGDVKNIDTVGNVTVNGNVTGDIDTTGNVIVSGDVNGDVDCMGNIRINKNN